MYSLNKWGKKYILQPESENVFLWLVSCQLTSFWFYLYKGIKSQTNSHNSCTLIKLACLCFSSKFQGQNPNYNLNDNQSSKSNRTITIWKQEMTDLMVLLTCFNFTKVITVMYWCTLMRWSKTQGINMNAFHTLGRWRSRFLVTGRANAWIPSSNIKSSGFLIYINPVL